MTKVNKYKLVIGIISILLFLIIINYFLLNYSTYPIAEMFLLILWSPFSIILFLVSLFLKTNRIKVVLLATLSTGMIVISLVSSGIINNYQINQSYERAEKVILAVEEYKEEKGEYPDSIERLLPKYLKTIPKPLTLDSQFSICYDDLKKDHLLIFSSAKYIHYYSFESNKGWNVMGGH